MNIGVKFGEKLVKNGWNKIPKGLIKQSLLNCSLKVCVKLFIRCVFLNHRYAHIRFLYDIVRNAQFGANKQKNTKNFAKGRGDGESERCRVVKWKHCCRMGLLKKKCNSEECCL